MASEEQNKEEVEQAEGGKKSYWWLTLSLLLVFLAGGGYFALKAMRQTAQTLAGVENPGQLSADSGVSGGDARGKADNVFASEEPGPAPAAKAAGSALNDKLKPGWVKELVAETAAKDAASQAATSQGPQPDGAAQGGQAAAASHNGGSMSSRLEAKAAFGGRAGALSSKTAAPSAVQDFQSNGAVVGKPSMQRTTAAGAPRKSGSGGVMDALKGAFRASFYGARVASQDAAKGWIAKSFDASPDAETSIHYDDKMKAKLDVVNPNSIPQFLRDQDVSAAEAKTLGTSAVGDPSMDKDSTKDSLDEDKDYQKKKAANDLAKSVINPLFAGLGSMDLGGDTSATTDPTDPTSGDPTTRNAQDPNADPSLGSVDEYGNTTMPGADGMNYIFDPDGKLLGCDNGSMCIMPGGDGCGAGITMS